MDFANNLAVEGFIEPANSGEGYGFTQMTPRQDALSLAVKMKRNRGENVSLVSPTNYMKPYVDVDYSGTGALSWLPGIVETGLKYGIITDARTEFEAKRNVTRAEAFSMVMTSVCMPIPDVSADWQE